MMINQIYKHIVLNMRLNYKDIQIIKKLKRKKMKQYLQYLQSNKKRS